MVGFGKCLGEPSKLVWRMATTHYASMEASALQYLRVHARMPALNPHALGFGIISAALCTECWGLPIVASTLLVSLYRLESGFSEPNTHQV